MISKVIHYCWFGRAEKPKLAQKCIESWKKYCPDFDIIEWNEDNFDVEQYPYLKWCYDHKKWAFLSDFARLLIVRDHGGIYFDTDVELLSPLDELLEYEAFYGFENDTNIATGLGFGAEKDHPTVTAMIEKYLCIVPNAEGDYPLQACPALNTQALIPMGLVLNGTKQCVAGAEILPADYLNPYDDSTGRLCCTEHTVSVHWYSKSWISPRKRMVSSVTKVFHRIFGKHCFDWLKKVIGSI